MSDEPGYLLDELETLLVEYDRENSDWEFRKGVMLGIVNRLSASIEKSHSQLVSASKFIISVKEILEECRNDFSICPRCSHQDDDVMKDSDLVSLLSASLKETLKEFTLPDDQGAA